MSKILENLLREQNFYNQDPPGFDLTKSPSSNDVLYKKINPLVSLQQSRHLPITPKKSTWEEVIENNAHILVKTFETKSAKHLLYMLNEVIRKAESLNHHPKIYINHDKIEFKLTTNTLNDITELDLELAKFIDEIYEDIAYIGNF